MKLAKPTAAGAITTDIEPSSPIIELEPSTEWAPAQSPQELYQKLVKRPDIRAILARLAK